MLLISGSSKEPSGWVEVSNFPNIVGYRVDTRKAHQCYRFLCSGFVAWPSNGDLWFNLEPETKSHQPSPQLPAPRPDVSDASLQAYKRQCITNVSVLCLRLSVSGGVLLVGQRK